MAKISEQLAMLGFAKLPGQSFRSPTGAFFLHTASRSKTVEIYLTVRHLPRNDRYEIMFGLNCPELRERLKNIKTPSNSITNAIARMDEERPHCWYRLPIRFGCRLNTWSCPSNPIEMEICFSSAIGPFIKNRLIPIDSGPALLQVYLTDADPFEWVLGTSYFARLCEIAYLVASTESNYEIAQKLAAKYYLHMCNSDSFGSKLPMEFFSELVRSIDDDLHSR